jgi:hypothetical protein
VSRPFRVALVTLAVLAAFALAVLAGHGWDPRAFVLERPADIPPEQTWAVGYDGQQSYAIALDPLGPAEGLDFPHYRYLRIVYPVLSRILALGRASLIPWAMIAVNLASAGVSAGLLAALCERRGANGAWSLFFFLSFNYLIVLRFDLTEPLAFALALGGLWWHERGRVGLAGAAFALAGLTRDITLAFPLALAVAGALRGRWREAAYLAGVSVGAYVGWTALVWAWLPGPTLLPAGLSPVFPPFSGITVLEPPEARVLVLIWAVGPAVVAGAAGVWRLIRAPAAADAESSWLLTANAGLMGVIPLASWVDPLAVLRLALGLMAALLLWLCRYHPRALRWAAALWVPSAMLALIIPGYIA